MVALVGILATFVRLAIGDGGRGARLRDTAQLVQQLAAAAAQEAVFTSRPIALVLDRDHFELQELRDGAWQKRLNDALYRARAFPPGIEVRVAAATRENSPVLSPHAPAVFFPDGTAETLQIELRDTHGDARIALVPDAEGYAVSPL